MKIGVVGGGQMGAALVKGFLRAGIATAAEVTVVDTDAKARARLSEETGVATTADVADAARGAELLIAAVKPQVMGAVLPGVAKHLEPGTTVLSIAAGVTTQRIEEILGAERSPRVVRAMPNTPCLVGEGMSAICAGRFATDEDMDRAERALGAAGKVTRTDESKINAVTGVSGSGPAYVYTFINALADGGVKMGLPKAQALELGRTDSAWSSTHGGGNGRAPYRLAGQSDLTRWHNHSGPACAGGRGLRFGRHVGRGSRDEASGRTRLTRR